MDNYHEWPLAAELLHVPPVLLGRPAGSAVALGKAELRGNGARGSVVREAVRRSLGANAFRDQSPYFEDPLPTGFADPDGVADDHALRGLRGVSVDADVPGAAGSGGRGSGLVSADRPQPGIHPDIRWR